MSFNRRNIIAFFLILAAFGTGWALPRGSQAKVRAERGPTTQVATVERERDTALQQLREERGKCARLEAEMAPLREALTKAETAQEEPAPMANPEPEQPLLPPTDEELTAGLQEFRQNLRNIIVGNEQGVRASEQVRELLARAGPEGIAKLVGRFEDDTESMGARIILAHALAQSHDPVAIAALDSQLRDPDAGMMVHRFASHALAFSDAEGVDVILSRVAHYADDRGARANAAFGLARKGSDEGIKLYFKATDESFEAGDPAALQYIGGLQLLGDKALPGVRERLLSYTNEQALLVLIGSVRAAGDEESVPVLEELANDGSRPASVRKAAAAALQILRKTN